MAAARGPVPEAHCLINELMPTAFSLWPLLMACALWPVGYRLWRMAYCLQFMPYGLSPIPCGTHSVAHNRWLWATGHDPLLVACALWIMACILWHVACGFGRGL